MRKHGLPASLYVDRDSIYRCEGQPSVAQQLAGKAPQTQFGRAMEALGVELILAHSPQAKGRVERMNGTLQDRLVKELRLAGISDMESANRFLEGKYLRAFHRQFGREAASPLDVHREVPRNLDEVLSWEEERVVQGDWTVACEGKRYQLDRQHEAMSLVRRKVIVRRRRKGGAVGASGQAAQMAEAGERNPEEGVCGEEEARGQAAAEEERARSGPSVARGRSGEKVSGQDPGAWGNAARGGPSGGGREFGQPTLRSGLPASCTPRRGERRPSNQGDILS